jgi:hypothetical protein
MKRLLFTLPLLIVAYVFVSCSKDDGNTPELTKKEMLTGHVWVTSAMTISPALSIGGVSVTDLYSRIWDCSKDNSYTFNKDSSFNVSEEANSCDPVTSVVDGQWTFNSNESAIIMSKIITFNFDFGYIQTNGLNINSMTDNKIILSMDLTVENTSHVLTITFGPK